MEPEFTRHYWGHESHVPEGWGAGAPWHLITSDDHRTLKHVGKVIECLPERRLSVSWADPEYADDPARYTVVTLDLEAVRDMVRLTVTHERLYPEMAAKISYGWPLVMASLKSLLETGQPLRIFG